MRSIEIDVIDDREAEEADAIASPERAAMLQMPGSCDTHMHVCLASSIAMHKASSVVCTCMHI